MPEQNTALILKVTGSVRESNISEFEKNARTFLDGINTSLVTDQDFGEAKVNIDLCKDKETQIYNAQQKAIMSMVEVSEILTTCGRVSEECREKRLMLNTLVKSEEAKRKKEITDNGIKRVSDKLSTSPARSGFVFDKSAIIGAIKGKRSISKMEEAVDDLVEDLLNDIEKLEVVYLANTEAITTALVDYPLLFADKRDLVFQPIGIVALTIKSRISEFEIQEQKRIEAQRLAAEAKKKKEEEDRIAKEKAEAEQKERAERTRIANEKLAKEQVEADRIAKEQQPEPQKTTFTAPPTFSDPPQTLEPYEVAPEPFTTPEIIPTTDESIGTVVFEVHAETKDIRAIEGAILAIGGVCFVKEIQQRI